MEKDRFYAVAFSALVIVGCQANASVKAGGDTSSAKADADLNAKAFSDSPPAGSSTPPPAAGDAGAPVSDGTLPQGCTLTCVQPNVGRLNQADEARLTSGLADTANAVEACYPNRRSHTFQLRFNSASNLTGFGVDIDSQDGPPCMSSIRQRFPALTMAGPSTIRCHEKCRR